MLNGIDPIIIFNFKKLPPSTNANPLIPVAEPAGLPFDLPAIPIYLSERLSGLLINSEDKNIDIDTTTVTLTNGESPIVTQRPINSTVSISMTAERDSIGISLFSALSDLIIPKLTSKEYSITYLHGAVTVFKGLLHSFSITQNDNDTRYNINLSLINPSSEPPKVVLEVPALKGPIPL